MFQIEVPLGMGQHSYFTNFHYCAA